MPSTLSPPYTYTYPIPPAIPTPHLCYYAPSTAPPPSGLSQTFADYILDLLHLLDLYS